MTERTTRRLLAALLALFALLGSGYAAQTPLFESPDESSHLQVIQALARERRLLPPAFPDEPVSTGRAMASTLRYRDPPLYYTPPLYHALGALLVGGALEDLPERLVPSPSWEAGYAPERGADPYNKNVYAHLPGENPAQSATFRAALVLRALSLLFGAVTVVSAYAIARRLRPGPEGRGVALGAASVVALNPQFVALSAGVTNDPLTNAIFGMALLGMVGHLLAPISWRRWAALGALVGAGLLVKQSAMLLLPLGAMAIVGPWIAAQPFPWRRAIACGAAYAGAALAVGGWWYARNALLYDDPLGLATHFESQVALQGFGLHEALLTFRSYWASFGWALLEAPTAFYILAGIALLLSAAGLIRAARPGGSIRRAPAGTRRGLLLLGVALALNAASLTRWAVATGAPYGRLLFPSATAVGTFVAWGLAEWRDHRAARLLLGALLLGAVAAAALIPWLLLRPAFAHPAVAALPEAMEPLEVEFAPGIRMRGYRLEEGPWHPGERVALATFWESGAAPEQRYSVWVQVSSADPTARVAGETRWLGGTLYPADLWRAGELARQRHALVLPPWAPAPALYWVHLGLLDAEGNRVPLAGGDDVVTLPPRRLRPTVRVVRPAHPLTARVGDHVQLVGYEAKLGAAGAVTLTWRAAATPAADYAVFVHLVDGEGHLLAQHDGPPVAGAYPTSWWLPGDVVVDPHPLARDDLPVGPLELRVGLYDPATGRRLPAYDAEGAPYPEDAVIIPIRNTQ